MRVELGKTTEVRGALIPLTASLDIITSPTGARILLDTINLGVTPVSLPNLTVGNYTLTVVKEGCIPAEQRVTVVEDRTTQIIISLAPVSPPIVDTLRAAGPVPATLIVSFNTIILVIRHLRI